MANRGKTRQIEDVIRSKIVVEIGVFYYRLPCVTLGDLECTARCYHPIILPFILPLSSLPKTCKPAASKKRKNTADYYSPNISGLLIRALIDLTSTFPLGFLKTNLSGLNLLIENS